MITNLPSQRIDEPPQAPIDDDSFSVIAHFGDEWTKEEKRLPDDWAVSMFSRKEGAPGIPAATPTNVADEPFEWDPDGMDDMMPQNWKPTPKGLLNGQNDLSGLQLVRRK